MTKADQGLSAPPFISRCPCDAGSAGGDEKAQQRGWLKDKYGVSWHVIPTVLTCMLTGHDGEKSQLAMAAILQILKPDIDTLKRAYAGI